MDSHLLIGIPQIDGEHQALFSVLERLKAQPAAHPSSEAFSEILNNFGQKIAEHFENEEAFLNNCGMPAADVAAHIEAHTAILTQYAELQFDLMEGRTPDYPDVVQMLGHWIVQHLVRFDLPIRNYRTAS